VREGFVEVRRLDDSHLALHLPLALSAQAFEIVARVQRLFDLRADSLPITQHLSSDAFLSKHVAEGLRVPGAWEPFEMAVRAILGQQISVQRARDLAREITLQHGEALPHGLLFPTAARLAEVELKGMPGARARCIRALAHAVSTKALRLDAATTIEELRTVPGIGPWTAEVIALRALGQPDAFPSGDLGLCKTLQMDPRALEARAERWRPWRSYAAAAIWSTT
jgi:3-methyladenine DNA glycosylase/8-oxoguanine DNA glycosylase